jgi:hypothetical protein
MNKYFITAMALTIIATLYLVIYKNYVQFNSTVSIKNTHWKKVHIQIHKGYHTGPDNNKLIFDQYLIMGQSRTFTVNDGDDILYRRDKDPDHPDGKSFTNWAYANCDDSFGCTVDNP